MNHMPMRLRAELERDPFMSLCIHRHYNYKVIACSGGVPEWHHVWRYAGRQIQERFAVVPVCCELHRNEQRDRDFIRWVSLNKASEEELARYPRIDWAVIRANLDETFGHLRMRRKTGIRRSIPLHDSKIDMVLFSA